MKNVRKLKEPFLSNCTDLFGEENGILVYEFYRYALHNIKGGIGDQSSKRLKHLMKTLEWAQPHIFLKAVLTLNDRFYNNTFKQKMSEQYFRTTLERMVYGAAKIDKVTKTISTPEKLETSQEPTEVTPIKYKKVRENYEGTRDYLNYDYECPSCKFITDPWKLKCNCGNIFNWKAYSDAR